MGYTVLYEDILFIEGDDPLAAKVAQIGCDLSFQFGAQLKNLNDVKRVLANQARANNCNCVVAFTYGQKSRWLAIDDVAYKGAGIAARLPIERYNQLVDKCRSS